MGKNRKIITALFLVFSFIFAVQLVNAETPKKKIIMLKDDDGEFFNAVAGLIGNLFEQKGWTKDNSEYIVLSMEGKAEKADELVNKIKELKPDVILMNTTLIKPIGMKLKESGLPCVAGGGLELEDDKENKLLVDEKGNPTSNITGTYTMPQSHLVSSFRLLDRIAPIKNKKAVFATLPSAAFSKSKVTKAFVDAKIPLKDFKEFTNVEDYVDFIKKYNADKEVGWILSGEPISRKKDGSAFSFEEFYKLERETNKKPNLGFWEDLTAKSKLCGIAIDAMTTVGQMVTMGDRILKGEKVSQVKPEDPAKTLIILNQARAKELKIEFPVNVLQGAWKVYTDYEGHYLGEK